jgi:nucleotide-binding universal stress UspA family protein
MKTSSDTDKEKPQPIRPAKILVSTDFSNNSCQALPYANTYAQQFGAEVYLVHVIEEPPFMSDVKNVPLVMSDKQLQQKAHNDLDALAAEEFDEAVKVHPMVRHGKAKDEIVAAARELNVDLIMISTHGRTGLKRALLGSVAEVVVRHAHCPVLVVRRTE